MAAPLLQDMRRVTFLLETEVRIMSGVERSVISLRRLEGRRPHPQRVSSHLSILHTVEGQGKVNQKVAPSPGVLWTPTCP